jgi:putative endonuclease
MKPVVYILKSESGKYYIGSTDNLDRRLNQHNSGHTHSTKRMGNLSLVFCQEYETLKNARNIEFSLKKLKRKDYIEKIVKEGYIKMMPR